MDLALTPEQPTTREVILHARLADAVLAERVEVRAIRILAGYAVGRHVHNGPVVGSIVEGSALRSSS